jgi:hypothetical protein
MKKILTRIETSVGYETYRLLIESKGIMSRGDGGYYYILDASIISVLIIQSNNSLTNGPFKIGFYDILKFPIEKTLMSQQSLDYGDVKNKTEE